MNTDIFQDTIEKDVDTDSENSDMFDYLTGNSTVMETKGTTINIYIMNSYMSKMYLLQTCLAMSQLTIQLICSLKDIPTDCSELFNQGEKNSGVYTIMPNGSEPFNVYCKMSLGG